VIDRPPLRVGTIVVSKRGSSRIAVGEREDRRGHAGADEQPLPHVD
jgi:hypothetical protein